MQKLVPKEEKPSASTAAATASGSRRTGIIMISMFFHRNCELTMCGTPSNTGIFYGTDTEAVSVDPSAGGLLEGMGLDGDTLAPMETDEPTSTDPKAKSKLTPAMATRIKQIKPLLSGEAFFMCTCKII